MSPKLSVGLYIIPNSEVPSGVASQEIIDFPSGLWKEVKGAMDELVKSVQEMIKNHNEELFRPATERPRPNTQ